MIINISLPMLVTSRLGRFVQAQKEETNTNHQMLNIVIYTKRTINQITKINDEQKHETVSSFHQVEFHLKVQPLGCGHYDSGKYCEIATYFPSSC